jgi:hypothetical protein
MHPLHHSSVKMKPKSTRVTTVVCGLVYDCLILHLCGLVFDCYASHRCGLVNDCYASHCCGLVFDRYAPLHHCGLVYDHCNLSSSGLVYDCCFCGLEVSRTRIFKCIFQVYILLSRFISICCGIDGTLLAFTQF